MSTTTTTMPPITFEQFDTIYRARLADADQPSCYVAYVRAEAEVETLYGVRRYKNYATFVATRTRQTRRNNGSDGPIASQIAIKCKICDNTLFTVPSGDLRTLIPHICEGCRDKIRKIIFA